VDSALPAAPMRRAPTVVSMKQLVADSQQQASSSPAAAGGAAAAAGEKDGAMDASVVSVAGRRLPAYVYDDSAPNKLLPRRPSWWEEAAGGAEGATGEGSSSPALDICGDSSGCGAASGPGQPAWLCHQRGSTALPHHESGLWAAPTGEPAHAHASTRGLPAPAPPHTHTHAPHLPSPSHPTHPNTRARAGMPASRSGPRQVANLMTQQWCPPCPPTAASESSSSSSSSS